MFHKKLHQFWHVTVYHTCTWALLLWLYPFFTFNAYKYINVQMYNVFHFIIIFSLFITTINDLVSEFQSMMVSGQDTQTNLFVRCTCTFVCVSWPDTIILWNSLTRSLIVVINKENMIIKWNTLKLSRSFIFAEIEVYCENISIWRC
jgi:hypothetical protein